MFRFAHRMGLIVALVGLFVVSDSSAQRVADDASDSSLPAVQEFTLPNGMTLLVYERPEAATVDCNLVYNVGGADEWAGVTGLAHFTEHLMFKGTTTLNAYDYQREAELLKEEDDLRASLELYQADAQYLIEAGEEVPKDMLDTIGALRSEAARVQQELGALIKLAELDDVYTSAGGTGVNANTWMHRTVYTVTLPENALELFFWIEADRMSNPVFRQFYSERDVVLEERLMSVENQAIGRIHEILNATLYESATYGSPVLGWPSDVRRVKRPQAIDFWRTFYRPDNAALVLVGKVDADRAYDLALEYFGALENPEKKIPRRVTELIEPSGPKRSVGPHIGLPTLFMAWPTPGANHRDSTALEMLSRVLSLESGPLRQRLVDTEKAVSAGAFQFAGREAGMFGLYAVAQNATLDDLEKELVDLMEEVRLGGILKRDFLSAQSSVLVEQTASLAEDRYVSSLLVEGFASGNWRGAFERNALSARLQVEDLAQAAASHLEHDQMYLMMAVPAAQNTPSTPVFQIPGVPEEVDDAPKVARAAVQASRDRFTKDHFEARAWYDMLASRAVHEEGR